MSEPPSDATPGVIICPVAPWYYRRMGLLALMLAAMGLYFIYDGKLGYPKANKAAEVKAWFEREVLADYDAAAAKGPDAAKAWVEEARHKGLMIKPGLEAPRWSDYAAPHGWPENPKHYTQAEIQEQYYYGGGLVIAAAVVGVIVLLNHNKRFEGHADHMVMPNGEKVAYRDVFRVDTRKWEIKALAYAWHRPEGSKEAGKRVTIDDLKYDGSGKVLDRLMSQFKGELIEKLVEAPAGETAESDEASSPPRAAT